MFLFFCFIQNGIFQNLSWSWKLPSFLKTTQFPIKIPLTIWETTCKNKFHIKYHRFPNVFRRYRKKPVAWNGVCYINWFTAWWWDHWGASLIQCHFTDGKGFYQVSSAILFQKAFDNRKKINSSKRVVKYWLHTYIWPSMSFHIYYACPWIILIGYWLFCWSIYTKKYCHNQIKTETFELISDQLFPFYTP